MIGYDGSLQLAKHHPPRQVLTVVTKQQFLTALHL